MRSKRLWLCVAPCVLCLLDHGVTLWGQPAEYWAGDYRLYNEFNPVIAWGLERHPVVVVIQTVLWVLLFSWLIVLLPQRLAKLLALALVFGNAAGAGMWLTSWRGYWAYPVLFLGSAALVVWTWERAGAERDRQAASG